MQMQTRPAADAATSSPPTDRLTLEEVRLAAAAVTAQLPRYTPTLPAWRKLKALQLRLFLIEQTLTGDHRHYIAAHRQIDADELAKGQLQ